jgi:predicted dithiol-disulfide oxidoreductase (DUF899 family)
VCKYSYIIVALTYRAPVTESETSLGFQMEYDIRKAWHVLWGMYQWLDRAPKGRNETGPWFRRHDEIV